MTNNRRFATVRTWMWFILLATLVGATVSFAASQVVAPTFAGRTTILVSPMPREAQLTNSDVEVARVAAATLGELATTGPILKRAIETTGVVTDVVSLRKVVTTRVPVGTSLLDISVITTSATGAADLANAIAAELIAYAAPAADGGNSAWQVDATVVDPAVPAKLAEGLGTGLTTLLGAGVALVIAISLAFLIENLRAGNPLSDRGSEGDVKPEAASERAGSRQPIG